jgi:ADP-ribose pyrophosphatase
MAEDGTAGGSAGAGNYNDKPQGTRIGWHLLSTTYPFVTQWLRLRQDRVLLEGKGEIDFTYHDHPGTVVVVPVTWDDQVVLIRQYRYTVDEWTVEVPAGGLHDAQGMALEAVAHKELREEIGATCQQMRYVNFFYSCVGQSNQRCHVFLATGVELTDQQTAEDTESIELVPTPVGEALHMARTGQIKDGISALALLMCFDLLKADGYI